MLICTEQIIILSLHQTNYDHSFYRTTMKEFLLLFRANYNEIGYVSDEKMQEWNDNWLIWLKGLVAKNALAEGGNHLDSGGKVIRDNGVITNGPYMERNESILGYILIKANSYEHAVEFAKDCPILDGEGNSVEVREIAG